MTVVKFCGIRSSDEVSSAIRAGCDLVGLNFVPASPRYLSIEKARELVEQHRAHVVFVGVFRDASREDVQTTIDGVGFSFLQFSGSESNEFCNQFDLPFLKSLPVSEHFDFDKDKTSYQDAWAFLLDTVSPLGGGSGRAFDWNRFPKNPSRRLLLAGGLTPENVADAISRTKPWGVDVASGIESSQGVKHRDKMMRFMQAVRHGRA